MEVHFDSHLEARLTERATQQGRKPDEFVQDVVARYLDEEERLVEAVKRGEDALSAVSISPMSRWASDFGDFSSPDGNPLVGIAVYQIKKDAVEISRIYHAAQDWP